MRLLDKYIGREVASHAVLGLAVFTFVLFVPKLVQLMDLIVRHSGGFGTVALLFLCALPPALIFTIPMAVLVGVLIGLGRLSADSEIVALHASGISLRRLLAPIGCVAFICGLGTMLITFWLSPASMRTFRRLQEQILSSQAPFSVQPRVFDERFPHLVLYVRDVEAGAAQWRGVFLASSGGSLGSAITTAQGALVLQGQQKGELELHLGPGSTHEYDAREPDRYNFTTFGETDVPVDISNPASTSQSTTPSFAELSVSALLAEHGVRWRDARVELQSRIALPAACLVFALLGVPIGVRPRRGGRAAGLILTLVLIGGYYFAWVTGDHMARQGSLSPWVGIWSANIAAAVAGLFFLRHIETLRRPNRILAWIESMVSGWRRTPKRASPRALGAVPNALVSNGLTIVARPALETREAVGAGRAVVFPLLVDTYLLQRFLYYFFVLLASFVLIFDAFTLFDLLGDISKNHIPVTTVLSYFRYLVPFMLYTLAPLATLVATLVTLAVLAKNNEIIAFKASGISMYRLILPLALAGCLIAGGMFLLGETYLPYANQRQDSLRNQIKNRPAQTYFQPTHQWIFAEGDKVFNYDLFDPARQLFGGLNVFELDGATFQIRRRIFATRAIWEPTQSTWVLTGGWVRDFEGGHVVRYTPFQVTSLAEINEPPSYFSREVRQSDQMNWGQLESYIARLRQAGFDTSRLTVQWHEKLAYPLIAAIIVCLGAPFAFLVGTRGAIGGLALAVGVGIVYRAAAALLEAMGTAGLLPPLLAGWAPDAIFGFLAVYFFLKMPT
jgi:LPS export ABC transporter permease LptF/LPS export ABC transporter permease LptG